MKDFVGSRGLAGHSRHSTRSRGARAGWGKLLLLVGAAGLAVLAAGSIVRALHWSDIFAGHTSTALLVTEKVEQSGAAVVQFQPEELRIDVYPVGSELPVEVMGGYGTYRFQAVYPLLQLEEKGLPYIRSTLSVSLGVLLDEVWHADVGELTLRNQRDLSFFLLKTFWHNPHISLTEKLSWLALSADQRTEGVIHEPLSALPAPEFENLHLRAESLCTVALINTTPLNGLAGRIASLLENQNFRVVRTVSDTTPVQKTTLLMAEQLTPDCAPLVTKIEKLVPGGVEHQRNEDEAVRNRADVVVKLGTDLVQ